MDRCIAGQRRTRSSCPCDGQERSNPYGLDLRLQQQDANVPCKIERDQSGVDDVAQQRHACTISNAPSARRVRGELRPRRGGAGAAGDSETCTRVGSGGAGLQATGRPAIARKKSTARNIHRACEAVRPAIFPCIEIGSMVWRPRLGVAQDAGRVVPGMPPRSDDGQRLLSQAKRPRMASVFKSTTPSCKTLTEDGRSRVTKGTGHEPFHHSRGRRRRCLLLLLFVCCRSRAPSPQTERLRGYETRAPGYDRQQQWKT